jgi:hypothetical protein
MTATEARFASSFRTWFNNAANLREVSKNLDYISSKLRLYRDELERHSKKICKNRKTMETITVQVVAQEKQNNGHKQLITDVEKKAEVEIEWLRSDFVVQKVRNNQLEAYIANLMQSVTESGRLVTALRSNAMPVVHTPLDKERRRSSQKEAPLLEAAVQLNYRMDNLQSRRRKQDYRQCQLQKSRSDYPRKCSTGRITGG